MTISESNRLCSKPKGWTRHELFGVIVLGVYAFVLIGLGARRFIPDAYNWAWGTDIGTWAMYREKVEHETEAAVVCGDSVCRITPRHFLWHNELLSTAHPHLTQEVVDAFAKFLASNWAVRSLVPPGNDPKEGKIIVTVRYRVNDGPEQTIRAETPLATNK